MRKRTKARECALKVLYQVDITGDDFEVCLKDFWESKGEFEDSVKDFTSTLVAKTFNNAGRIDDIIGRYATNWQVDRMAMVDRNILRLATCELVFIEDIPDKVSINEAVEIAKKYGDSESSKFVNGILDKISKEEKKHAGEG